MKTFMYLFFVFSSALNHMVPEAEKIPKPEHCFFGVDTNVGSQVYNDKIAVCKTALKSLMDKIQAKKTFSDANYVENFILNEFMTGLTDYTNAEKTYDHLKAFLTEYIKDTSSPNSIDTKDPERVRCLVDQVEELHKAGNPQSITHMANELRKLLRRIDYETDKPAEKKHTETTTSTARTTSTGSAETIKTSTGTTGTAESAKTTETTETSNTGVHLPRIY